MCLDEQNCGRPKEILTESWNMWYIVFISLCTAVALLMLVGAAKNYRSRVRSDHSTHPAIARPLPQTSSSLLPSCPSPPPRLPPPYSEENTSPFTEEDLTKPPACDIIIQGSG